MVRPRLSGGYVARACTWRAGTSHMRRRAAETTLGSVNMPVCVAAFMDVPYRMVAFAWAGCVIRRDAPRHHRACLPLAMCGAVPADYRTPSSAIGVSLAKLAPAAWGDVFPRPKQYQAAILKDGYASAACADMPPDDQACMVSAGSESDTGPSGGMAITWTAQPRRRWIADVDVVKRTVADHREEIEATDRAP